MELNEDICLVFRESEMTALKFELLQLILQIRHFLLATGCDTAI